MATTRIEWADEVWNPIIGCSRVSKGCEHCYAERMAMRMSGADAQEIVAMGSWTSPQSVSRYLHVDNDRLRGISDRRKRG